MTSLRINTGTSASPIWSEVELPENWSLTLVSENVIMTKSSEYTYDCEINLLGSTRNVKIFGMVRRPDATKRGVKYECMLIVNNKTIIDRGTAVINEITNDGLKLQLLGGNSEVNFRTKLDKMFIDKIDLGNAMDDINNLRWKYPHHIKQSYERKISGLREWVKFASDMGMITKDEPEMFECYQTGMIADIVMRTSDDFPFVMLPAVDPNNNNTHVNVWGNILSDNNYICCKHPRKAKDVFGLVLEIVNDKEAAVIVDSLQELKAEDVLYCPQPFMVTIIEKVMDAIGYEIDINEIRNTNFKNVYICNTTATVEYRQMLPHWSVNKFMEEVENFFGCVFVFKKDRKVDIIIRNNYFKIRQNNYLKKVIDDSWKAEPWNTEEKDVSTATVKFKMQNEDLMDLFDDTINDNAVFLNNNDPNVYFADKQDPTLHNTVIHRTDNTNWIAIGENKAADGDDPEKKAKAVEANQLRKLDRGEDAEDIELSICPAIYKFDLFAQQIFGRHNYAYLRHIPLSNSFAIESGKINIEEYINEGEFEEGNDDGEIVVALWDGIDKMPTYDKTKDSEPYYQGWSHGYNKDELLRAKGINDVTLSKKMPEFRGIALRLVDVDNMQTLGNTFYGEGRNFEDFNAKIDTSVAYEIEFLDEMDLFDLRIPFIFCGHRYIAHNIERIVNKNGFDIVKKGRFFRINE